MKKTLIVLAVATLIFVVASPANADSIGSMTLTNCGTAGTLCPAATYAFNIGTTSATLSITVTGTPVTGSTTLQGVNLGFTSASNIVNLTGGSTTAGGTWTFTTGSLSNNGCTATSTAAFTCSFATPTSGFVYTVGNTYSWTWNYDPIPAGNIFAVGSVHVGANYGPNNGRIVSQTGAVSVPEPGTMLLFGAGLLGLGALRRRLS